MKVVQACLSVRKDLESSFHRCGGPVRIVQACLSARKRPRKQFSPLWRPCEDSASLFMCKESSGKLI